jgi:ABC-2 type transport system permease protein
MRNLRILATQTRFALITALRTQRVIVFSMVFPVVLLVMFNSIFTHGSNRTTHFAGGLITTAAYFTAGMAAYAIMLQTFTTLAISVTSQRESGQLKRLRGTPMPSWTFIAAYVLRAVVLVAAMVLVLFAIGVLAFGVTLRGEGVLGIVVYTLIGTASLASLGIAVTIVCPSADVASTLGPFVAVILSFISGVFIPVASLPDWLTTVGKVFPLSHLTIGLQRAVETGTAGTGLTGADVGVLLAWGFAGILVSSRLFRWEPQAARAPV